MAIGFPPVTKYLEDEEKEDNMSFGPFMGSAAFEDIGTGDSDNDFHRLVNSLESLYYYMPLSRREKEIAKKIIEVTDLCINGDDFKISEEDERKARIVYHHVIFGVFNSIWSVDK